MYEDSLVKHIPTIASGGGAQVACANKTAVLITYLTYSEYSATQPRGETLKYDKRNIWPYNRPLALQVAILCYYPTLGLVPRRSFRRNVRMLHRIRVQMPSYMAHKLSSQHAQAPLAST